jgi:TolB-like protein/DNA-binding winged helix-turn-helix (wHTH) protein/Flp pilus assembly protein TadD
VAVTVFEFGDFKLDCDRFELYRAGRSLKLERKPMELLVLLAAKNGHLVTRTEIAEHLWEKEVFVDTEHGINTAIRKIREVLQDDPIQSRFVQTVTGKGYRFTAPIIEVRPGVTGEESRQSAKYGNRRIGDRPAESAPPDVTSIQNSAGNVAEPPGKPEARPSPNPHLRVWIAATAALALLIVAIGLGARGLRDRSLARAAKLKISSLAVLPLDNLSGDPAQDYFADGMTDELTTMLAKNSTLRVVSRTSVMQYKGAHRPLREIAQELGVDGILEGSVERTGDKVHMTIQLIQAPTDTHVWAESYDRNANDVVSLPIEAAQAIAKKLDSAALQPSPQRYVNPEAHDAYLRGQYIWFSGENEGAGKYFRKATELQPDYAPGWAGLSMYYGQGVLAGDIDPKELALGEEAARKAVELDDSLPVAHLTLGAVIFINHWDWARADQEIARAIELDPNYAEAWHFRSKMYTALGRNEEAIAVQKKAMELGPFERPFAMALTYFTVRQYDAAINEARLRLETRPEDISLHWTLREAYRRKGMQKEAVQEWVKLWQLANRNDRAASIQRDFEEGGYKGVLLGQVRRLKQQSATQYVSPVDLSLPYAQLGRKEETLSLLEEGYRQHSPLLLWIQTDPAYDFLHAEERYRSIIKQIGLPPAY